MDFQRLKTFHAVATLMNFNRAATVLNYAQSSVSAQVKTLEEEVGAPLFKRMGKRVQLTDAGRKMVKYAEQILAMGEAALADVGGHDELEGILTIRAPQTVATWYLPKVLAAFQPRYPRVRLNVDSCAFHSLENELRIGSVDLAFLLTDSIQAAELEVELLATEELKVVAAPGHPLATRAQVGFCDLADSTFFLPKADCGYRMAFDQALATRRTTTPRITEFNAVEAIKQCVKAGLGVTVIPQIAVLEEFRKGELVPLAWEEKIEVGLLMIRHETRWVSPVLAAFVETVRSAIKEGE